MTFMIGYMIGCGYDERDWSVEGQRRRVYETVESEAPNLKSPSESHSFRVRVTSGPANKAEP